MTPLSTSPTQDTGGNFRAGKSVAPRRTFLGICALMGIAAGVERSRADVREGIDLQAIRWYRMWDTTKDWSQADAMLADDFTFTSAAGDDHISKADFKKNCWDTQVGHIRRIDVLQAIADRDAAFVMYNCVTSNDKTFRNVEFLQFADGKIKSIECYFGAPSNYPSAVSKRQEK